MAEEGIAAGGVMDVNTALQEVLKTALIHDGLARGIHEAAEGLDKRQAHLCALASNCDEPVYVKLVEAPYKVTARWQTNQTNKKCQRSPALCKPPHNHLPSHYLLPQTFPKRSGHSRGFSQPQSS